VIDAPVYQWRTEMQRLAEAAPLPPHVVARGILPFSTQFWSFEESSLLELLPEGQHYATSWAYLWDVPPNAFQDGSHQELRVALGLTPVQKDGAPDPPYPSGVMSFPIPYGLHWPEDVPEGERELIERFLQMLPFLNSPFVEKEGVPGLPRVLRRQLDRKAREPRPPEEVRVVTLRRPAHPTEGKPRGPRGPAQHHWWVTGHHRAQWYPSQEAHQVIWIRPYLKGDPDQPLLHKLYRVAR
jgi:hypothetical protein